MTALPKRAIRLTPKVVAVPGTATNGTLAAAAVQAPTLKPSELLTPSCPAQAAIEVIAAKWSLKILHRLTKGKARFNSLQRDLPGVSQKVLTQQLRKLEKHGLITRTVHTTVPPSVEYALTPAGAELKTALKDLHEWAKKYIKMNWADGKDC